MRALRLVTGASRLQELYDAFPDWPIIEHYPVLILMLWKCLQMNLYCRMSFLQRGWAFMGVPIGWLHRG